MRTEKILTGLAIGLLLAAAVVLSGVVTIRAHADAPEAGWSPQQVQARAAYYSEIYAVPWGWMDSVFRCESKYDAYAVGARGEIGAGQWMRDTWARLVPEPLRSRGPYDVDANVEATVQAFASGHSSEWSCA